MDIGLDLAIFKPEMTFARLFVYWGTAVWLSQQLATGVSTVASHGGQVVHQVVAAVQDMQASSAQIADIISVIDGIALQTNILALNAAIEVARDGDQGRGFAVVVSEVRTLVQRSAAAAKEIKGLIEDAGDKLALGSELVAKAGVSTDEIVTSVQCVTSNMAEISIASQEQTDGIERVSQTVVQLDEATQQNAALVEEATAAAPSMEDQAQILTVTGAVSRFRLCRTRGHEAGPCALDPGIHRCNDNEGIQTVDGCP